jgi:biofilm protein TabA
MNKSLKEYNMIIGKKLSDLKNSKGISKNLDIAIDYILSNDLIALEPGRYSIKDSDVTLIREDYEPRSMDNCYFEGHQNFLDIQIVLSGQEGFGYIHIDNPALEVTQEYLADKDVAKYAATPELVFNMVDESFAIVFPEDIHMPKIKVVDNSFVKKAVFKVKID